MGIVILSSPENPSTNLSPNTSTAGHFISSLFFTSNFISFAVTGVAMATTCSDEYVDVKTWVRLGMPRTVDPR